MAAARQKGTDFGAALAGLVFGGSVLFLVILTIVWLTNRKYEGKEAGEKAPAAVQAPAPSAAPAPAQPAPASH
jgi:hypothetical protein